MHEENRAGGAVRSAGTLLEHEQLHIVVFCRPMLFATDRRGRRYVVHHSPVEIVAVAMTPAARRITRAPIVLREKSGLCRASLTCAAAECDAKRDRRRALRRAMHRLTSTQPCTFLCTALRVAAFGLQRESA